MGSVIKQRRLMRLKDKLAVIGYHARILRIHINLPQYQSFIINKYPDRISTRWPVPTTPTPVGLRVGIGIPFSALEPDKRSN